MSDMKLYQMRHNTDRSSGWLYAAHIKPRSELVSNYCDGCGRGSEIPAEAFDVDVEGGWRFPDILQCGAYPFLIVSERVVSVWVAVGIDCFKAFKVRVKAVDAEKPVISAPPTYFRIEVTGTCLVNQEASGITVTSKCRKCGLGMIKHVSDRPFAIVDDSWNDYALFRDEGLLPRITFCNQEVRKLISKHKLTNFRFEQVTVVAKG